jgi:potassium voltage-gated channel Eag-related subfamily H protein 6
LIFLTDMTFTFRTAYVDLENDDNIVTNPKKIALRYLGFWFWVDLLAINPFDYIFLMVYGRSDIGSLGLLRLLRMSRVITLFQSMLNFKGMGGVREGAGF